MCCCPCFRFFFGNSGKDDMDVGDGERRRMAKNRSGEPSDQNSDADGMQIRLTVWSRQDGRLESLADSWTMMYFLFV